MRNAFWAYNYHTMSGHWENLKARLSCFSGAWMLLMKFPKQKRLHLCVSRKSALSNKMGFYCLSFFFTGFILCRVTGEQSSLYGRFRFSSLPNFQTMAGNQSIRRTPHSHGKSMQTSCRKATAAWDLNVLAARQPF